MKSGTMIGMGDGLVQLYDIDEMLGIPRGTCYKLRRSPKNVLPMARQRHRIWYVREEDIAIAATRVNCYRYHTPLRSDLNMTPREAADAMMITRKGVYNMAKTGKLRWARDEMWKMVTRESVRIWMRRRGMKITI